MNEITFSMTYYGQVERLQYQLDFLSEQKKTFTDNTTCMKLKITLMNLYMKLGSKELL